jgi:hypothetical protein
MSITEFLQALEACPEAVTWAAQFGAFEELWRACPHAEWMIWTLEEVGYDSDSSLRLFASACARHHWHLLTDPRSRRAIETAELFAGRMAQIEGLRNARQDARVAAEEGSRSKDWSAAAAAAATTAASTVLGSGLSAAREASKHGLRAAAWDPGTNLTADQEDSWQSDQLRRLLGPELPRIIELAHRKMEQLEQSRTELASRPSDCGCPGGPPGAASNGTK